MSRGLTVAICIDEKGGMLFGGKRQSKDRILIKNLLELCQGTIHITDFSRALFSEHEEKIMVSKKPYKKCDKGDVCFIEDVPFSDFQTDVDRLIIYKWNRHYPSDTVLNIEPESLGLKLVSSVDFAGSSQYSTSEKSSFSTGAPVIIIPSKYLSRTSQNSL